MPGNTRGRDRGDKSDRRRQPSRTGLLEFSARQDFHYRPNNASPQAEQAGTGGGRFLTSAQGFANQVLVRAPQQFHIHDTQVAINCLARAEWSTTRYKNQRILFFLPSQALGNNVCTLLFLQAFLEHCQPREVGVFCAQSASDIYLRAGNITVYALWLSRKERRRWDVVIDLGHLESRRNIEFWPVDMEADLLAAFKLTPSTRYATQRAPMASDRPLQIGLFPLASSPLRTLPVAATLAIINALRDKGQITLCLNRNQRQGLLFSKAIRPELPPTVDVIEAFSSIGDLLESVSQCDYIVAADSGPAHMAKLSAVPGVAVYTSAPGDVLQGRFSNLSCWTVPYVGDHCTAPCGLAGVRISRDGQVGCMGSLGVPAEDLPKTAGGKHTATVDHLFQNPVPCVQQLREHPRDLVEFIVADLNDRQTP